MKRSTEYIIIWTIMTIALALMFAIGMVGCKPCECLTTTEYRDSIVLRYQHDTIHTYEKDSVFIHQKGDTVWRERWSIRYRDKIVERHDTIYQDRQNEVVRVEKVVPTYYKGVSLAFWILVVLLVVATIVRVLIKVYLKK